MHFNMYSLRVPFPGEPWLIQAPGQKPSTQGPHEENFPGIQAGGGAEPARKLGSGEKWSDVLETGGRGKQI